MVRVRGSGMFDRRAATNSSRSCGRSWITFRACAYTCRIRLSIRIGGQLHFAEDLLGSIRMRRENQHHHFAVLDRPRNLAGKGAPRLHIPWSNPAADPGVFKCRANSISYSFVQRGVRDKNFLRHTILRARQSLNLRNFPVIFYGIIPSNR